MPFQGARLPANNCGWVAGRITAVISSSFATFRPATSSHLIFGFEVTITLANWLWSFLPSSASSSSWLGFAGFLLSRMKWKGKWNLQLASLIFLHDQYRMQSFHLNSLQHTDSFQLSMTPACLKIHLRESIRILQPSLYAAIASGYFPTKSKV